MIQSLKARWAVILIVLAAGLIWTMPNFVNTDKIWWPTKSRMVMGLDIQGGSHLVLRVDIDSAIKADATRLAGALPTELKTDGTEIKGVEMIDPLRGAMKINLNQAGDAAKVQAYIDKSYSSTLRTLETTPNSMTVEYAELHLRDFKARLLEQAIAVIRNRIDEFGVAEPSITQQGTDRVLVQLPGIQDAASAKDLINRTARLDFMMVSTEKTQEDLNTLVAEAEKEKAIKFEDLKYTKYVDQINEALKAKLPANTVLYFEKPDSARDMAASRVPHLMKTNETVPGDRLSNAFVGMGERGNPEVAFRFDPQGARMFGDMTGRNIEKPMAIVLDKTVVSIANIQSKITDSGRITLNRGNNPDTLKEAKVISTALRAGALPATLEQIEERTVGPSVGADAIRQGQIGTTLAAIGVFLFMGFYYRSYGVIADVALAFNLLLTVAILSALGATLTLPGVAGLALTLGISVDASVIIFERVKEEMSKGASKTAAIREGYDRAFSSILDSNLTSIAVCIVLMYFGTGPIRGFAVTLLTGLVITTFTAVFFTRSVLDLLVVKWKWNLGIQWKHEGT